MADAHPLDGLLEPASAPYQDAALFSIAISLKRIADHLAPNNQLDAPLTEIALQISQLRQKSWP